jgi:hypothetical protein
MRSTFLLYETLGYVGLFMGVLISISYKYAARAAPASGSLVDKLKNDYSGSLTGADLLVSNTFDVLGADVLHSAHIGQGVINGASIWRS